MFSRGNQRVHVTIVGAPVSGRPHSCHGLGDSPRGRRLCRQASGRAQRPAPTGRCRSTIKTRARTRPRAFYGTLLLLACVFAELLVVGATNPTTERVSVSSNGTEGNKSSDDPAISADGRYVAFYSYASNLVPGDTNGKRDVFVRDRGDASAAPLSHCSTQLKSCR
jgi:hypothetical protein